MGECIVTIATGQNALRDLKLLISSTQFVYEGKVFPDFYIYTNTESSRKIREISYKGRVYCKEALNNYATLTRKQMEQTPGKIYKTLWTDFMAEKINAMRWAFQENPGKGIWFLDADICLFAQLPVVPSDTEVALSPHYIRAADEAKYGRFNGGFLWMRNPALLDIWTAATQGSRFFEQSALENVAAATEKLWEFPIQINFGWWRLWQSALSPQDIQNGFGFHRFGNNGIGITFNGEPLQSVHTHFYETQDQFTVRFNQFLLELLERLGGRHKPAKDFHKLLRATG